MPEREIVYVLTNEAMPGLAKIGKTRKSDVLARMRELYTTGVPVPFECAYAIEVDDCSEVENALHVAFGPSRINPRREFFSIETEQAIAVLKLLPGTDVTPELNAELASNVSQAERESAEKIRKRRPQLNFAEMGIPDGALLTFKDGSVSVQVAGPRKVDMDGEIVSLTEATRRTLGIDYSVAPAPHWTYEGKLLRDYYNETYS